MSQNSTRRERGTGTIYQRENGTWQGKLIIGVNSAGKPKSKYFSGKTETEVKRKIREYNRAGAPVDPKKVTLEEYLNDWLQTYKKDTIKRSSFDALEKTARNQIIPNLGMLQLAAVTSRDIQKLLSQLKKEGYSYSTVKKVYDCFNGMYRHAVTIKDMPLNPMDSVNMIDKNQFEKKAIRFYNTGECARIVEEATRLYSTGAPVYVYGYVFILMLNTGIRLGEAIGLEKQDWDPQKKTLAIKRNVQSVKKRDEEGNAIRGRELITNTTKTYSGERVLPLNAAATEALNKLCSAHPYSKYIVCSSKGDMVPPERVERTFYYLLNNVGLEREGPHSLRHTFASLLFAKGVDVKTVSTLLGHASIQITLNTYIHLMENVEFDAVAKLDDLGINNQSA